MSPLTSPSLNSWWQFASCWQEAKKVLYVHLWNNYCIVSLWYHFSYWKGRNALSNPVLSWTLLIMLDCPFVYCFVRLFTKETHINTFQIPNTHSHLQNQTNWTKLPSLDAYISYHHRVEQSYEMDCLWINSTLFSSWISEPTWSRWIIGGSTF